MTATAPAAYQGLRHLGAGCSRRQRTSGERRCWAREEREDQALGWGQQRARFWAWASRTPRPQLAPEPTRPRGTVRSDAACEVYALSDCKDVHARGLHASTARTAILAAYSVHHPLFRFLHEARLADGHELEPSPLLHIEHVVMLRGDLQSRQETSNDSRYKGTLQEPVASSRAARIPPDSPAESASRGCLGQEGHGVSLERAEGTARVHLGHCAGRADVLGEHAHALHS